MTLKDIQKIMDNLTHINEMLYESEAKLKKIETKSRLSPKNKHVVNDARVYIGLSLGELDNIYGTLKYHKSKEQ